MGNYQEYLKKSIVPLRDPHADPDLPKQKGPTFGNPWKVIHFTDEFELSCFGFSKISHFL